MINVLFVCYGNICRSPMGEFILKDLVKKNKIEDKFKIESAGTSDEEEGNSIYYLAKQKLQEHNISCNGKIAKRLNKKDYEKYDYILAMEQSNIIDINRIFCKDLKGKVYRLLDFTKNPRDIEDPWYSRNFDKTYNEILEGCTAFIEYISKL
ncbi:MAG: low molecular weight phosphotyrosine protein phosphatase [Clostridia bacterium]|nr:low molecular weight phosphotyrosine protein phosphatase [Clostridia bacterium]